MLSVTQAFDIAGVSPPPWSVAAPSFVLPGTVRQNCAHLCGFFPEVALLLFETEACLAYGPEDLPGPGEFPGLTYHAHLPLDLPWDRGLDTAWGRIAALLDKVAPLSPRRLVLHPPPPPVPLAALAARFRDRGLDPEDVLLENVRERSLAAVWDEARDAGFGACLDLGHMLAYEQQDVAALPEVFERAAMLHLSAPGPGGRHRGLAFLDDSGRDLLRRLLDDFKPGGTVVLEVFEAPALYASLEILARTAGERTSKA